MILNCPNCSTRYLLSAGAIGENGRDVRCAKCYHEWFQMPDDDTLSYLQSMDNISDSEEEADDWNQRDDHGQDDYDSHDDDNEEDSFAPEEIPDRHAIPDAVKPRPESSNVPAYAKDVLRPQARLTGYGAAAMIFVVFISCAFIFKQKIASWWPATAIIYDLAGMPVTYKGENLIMESLSATVLQNRAGQEVLVLKGRVINLTDHVIDVPQIRAVLRSTNGEDGESWIIDAPVDRIEPGASFVFTSDYPAVPGGVGSVNLTFVPTVIGIKSTTPSKTLG